MKLEAFIMETYNTGVEEHPVRCLAAHYENCLAGAVSYHWRVGRKGFLFGTSSGCSVAEMLVGIYVVGKT